jgi:dipeptidyl aminopeptidase/acylaminoacyl peptidase
MQPSCGSPRSTPPAPSPRTKIGGGAGDAAFQPEWTPGGDLIFVAEETGWWNLYRWRAGEVEPLHPMEAEFGKPGWVFGANTFTVVDDSRLICAFKDAGRWSIGDLNLDTLELATVPTPWTEVDELSSSADTVAFIAANPSSPATVYRHDLASGETYPLRSSQDVA